MAASDISQLSGAQLAGARQVFDIALKHVADLSQADAEAAVLGTLTTVNDEATFTNHTNNGSYAGQQRGEVWGWYGGSASYRDHLRLTLNYGPDTGAGGAETTKDSVGLFQQREMYGYAGLGTRPHPDAPGRLMDPEWTVRVFIAGVPGQPSTVKHWLDPRCPVGLSIAQHCQWVQGSEVLDGGNYAESITCAQQLIDRFGGVTTVKPPTLKGKADMALIVTANDGTKPHMFIDGGRAAILTSGASSQALKDQGIPFAAITAADFDVLFARFSA